MNAEIDLLSESLNRVFADFIATESGHHYGMQEWPGPLWETIEEMEFNQSPLGQLAVTSAHAMGRFAIPLPLSENIIASSILGNKKINSINGPYGLLFQSQATDLNLDASEKLSGRVVGIPWALNCKIFVVCCQDTVLLIDSSDCTFVSGTNIAGEARDTVILDKVSITDKVVGVSEQSIFLEAALLKASQITGALDRLLNMSLDYVLNRKQFGRSISKFQVIQHQLAILAGHVASAEAAVQTAATSNCDLIAVGAAKAMASSAAGDAAAIAHQVHGALGFTAEHSLHKYTKALWAWREEYGNETYWNMQLGDKLSKAGGRLLWPSITG